MGKKEKNNFFPAEKKMLRSAKSLLLGLKQTSS
jgi:hypothetical protein